MGSQPFGRPRGRLSPTVVTRQLVPVAKGASASLEDLSEGELRHLRHRGCSIQARNASATAIRLSHAVARQIRSPEPGDVALAWHCSHCQSHEHGYPYFPRLSDIGLSYSTSGGLVLVAAAWQRRIGVDIERLTSDQRTPPISSTWLSEDERQLLTEVPDHERRHLLICAWTRKESALKSVGVGLIYPPNLVDVMTRDDLHGIENEVDVELLGQKVRISTEYMAKNVIAAIAVDADAAGKYLW